MTDLERFTAALLAQWRAEDGHAGGPISVTLLMEKILPYRTARRLLGIDVSEDYEALLLRLLAEEGRLVVVTPIGAADMARTTMASKLPDLGVLQLLRSATFMITDDTMARLDGVLPLPVTKEKEKDKQKDDTRRSPAIAAAAEPPAQAAGPEKEPGGDPAAATGPACWSCGEAVPGDREVKFCPFCGADQRQPKCASCGEAVERRWRHCVECGSKLWSA
jgi:hypothetical protein